MRGDRGQNDNNRRDLAQVDKRLLLKVGMASQKGPRQKNDDYCAISYKSDFYAISDGIGGVPYGDVVSRIACNAAICAYDEGASIDGAFRYANGMASNTTTFLGEPAGATLLLAEHREGILHLLWAGDSVAYRLRGDALRRVTEPGRVPGGGNALSKAVGYGIMYPDRVQVDVRAGDRFVLCTDGVWEYLKEDDFKRMVAEGRNAPLIADALCSRAATVGMDNSTCICIVAEDCLQDEDSKKVMPSMPVRFSVTPDANDMLDSCEARE